MKSGISKQIPLIHRYVDDPRPCSSVDLEFTDETSRKYKISRTFYYDKLGNSEFVPREHVSSISIDGSNWNGDQAIYYYVSKRLPSSVASFFIFDADFISRLLAESSVRLKSAISDALEVNVINSLVDDIQKIYDSELKTRSKAQENDKELQLIQTDIENKNAELRVLKSKLQKNSDDRDSHKAQISFLEERYGSLRAVVNPDTIKRRESLIQRETQLVDEIALAKKNLNSFLEKPYSLKPLEEYLIEAQSDETPPIASIEWIVSDLSDLKDMLSITGLNLGLESEVTFGDHLKLINRIIERIEAKDVTDPVYFYFLKPSQKRSLGKLVGELKTYRDIRIKVDILEKAEKELRSVRTEKSLIPVTNDQTLKEFESVSVQLLSTKEIVKDLDKSIQELKENIKVKEKEIKSLSETLLKNTQLDDQVITSNNRFNLLGSIVCALEYFERELIERALAEFCPNASYYLCELSEKKHVKLSIEIDPTDWSIRVFDKVNCTFWDMSQRSDAEQEIIAISLLRALADLSSCKAPIVVDSPTIRLSDLHRENLAFLLPFSAPQSIVFAGEQELTDSFTRALHDHVGVEYKLVGCSKSRSIEGGFDVSDIKLVNSNVGVSNE